MISRFGILGLSKIGPKSVPESRIDSDSENSSDTILMLLLDFASNKRTSMTTRQWRLTCWWVFEINWLLWWSRRRSISFCSLIWIGFLAWCKRCNQFHVCQSLNMDYIIWTISNLVTPIFKVFLSPSTKYSRFWTIVNYILSSEKSSNE